MASGAVFSDGSVVEVGVAGNTVGVCIRKDHGYVAGPAVHADMPAGKRKTGFSMAESRGIRANQPAGCFGENWAGPVPLVVRYFPTGRRMAVGTIHLELGAVRGLCKQVDCQPQKYQY